MNCNPFPSPTIKRCSRTAFWLGVKWAPVGRGAAPSMAPGPSHGGIGRVDSTQASQLKLRGKATEPAQNLPIQIMIEVCNHAKGGSLFQCGCQGIQAVVVDLVTGAFSRSARHQQTCNHASKQAAQQQNFHKSYIASIKHSIHCACIGGMFGS
jgi:hypothetical protein